MQALTFMVGLMVGSSTPVLADLIQNTFGVAERFRAVQYAIWAMFTVGVFLMAVPVFSINEKKYCVGKPLATPLLPALKHALKERNFRYFIVADCTYYTCLLYTSPSPGDTLLSRMPSSA